MAQATDNGTMPVISVSNFEQGGPHFSRQKSVARAEVESILFDFGTKNAANKTFDKSNGQGLLPLATTQQKQTFIS